MGRASSRLRHLIGGLVLAGLLMGCSTWFGDRQFDRCHQAERERDTLYFELYCRQRR